MTRRKIAEMSITPLIDLILCGVIPLAAAGGLRCVKTLLEQKLEENLL